MDKKEIYEHLAKIYLDASSGKKKKNKAYPKVLKNPFFVGTLAVIFIALSSLFFLKTKSYPKEVALFLSNDAVKINFDFDPAKKESYTLNLNKLDLAKYKSLSFSVKKAAAPNPISLRIEFTNTFREKSEVYVKNIPSKWQEYKIDFSEFKSVNNWKEMASLSFSVEEWNAADKKGLVYIDNVRVMK